MTKKIQDPFISFVIATKNAAQHIEGCLVNLRRFKVPIQIIVKDCGSSDTTAEIARRHCIAPDAVIEQADSGIYGAWNQALEAVSAPLVAFIGADDRPNVSWYEAHLNLMLTAKDTDFFYGDLVKHYNKRYRLMSAPEHLQVTPENLTTFWLPHPGLIHSRKLFTDQQFDEAYALAGDYEFVLRLAKARGSLSCIKLKGVQCVMEADGLSHRPEAFVRYRAEYSSISARLGVTPTSPAAAARLYWLLHVASPWAAERIRRLRWWSSGTAAPLSEWGYDCHDK